MSKRRKDQNSNQRLNVRSTLEHRPTILKTPTNCTAPKQKTSYIDAMSILMKDPSPEENSNPLPTSKMTGLTLSVLISKMTASSEPSRRLAPMKGLLCSTIEIKATEKRNVRQSRRSEHGAIRLCLNKQSTK